MNWISLIFQEPFQEHISGIDFDFLECLNSTFGKVFTAQNWCGNERICDRHIEIETLNPVGAAQFGKISVTVDGRDPSPPNLGH